MSTIIDAAIEALKGRLADVALSNVVKFDIEGEGAIMVGPDGVSAGDGEADLEGASL